MGKRLISRIIKPFKEGNVGGEVSPYGGSGFENPALAKIHKPSAFGKLLEKGGGGKKKDDEKAEGPKKAQS